MGNYMVGAHWHPAFCMLGLVALVKARPVPATYIADQVNADGAGDSIHECADLLLMAVVPFNQWKPCIRMDAQNQPGGYWHVPGCAGSGRSDPWQRQSTYSNRDLRFAGARELGPNRNSLKN